MASSIVRYLHGNIYTMDSRQPHAQAMAIDIRSGRIVAIGTNDDIQRSVTQYSETYDLHAKTVLPGFIDAHIHLLETAYRSQRIDASTCTSEQEVAELVRIRALQTPPGQWIQGGHWDRNLWSDRSFPGRRSLDAAAPQHPVALASKDGHLLWVNTRALQLAHIDRETPDPAGGTILHDSVGEPDGILQEIGATNLVFAVITPPDPNASRQQLKEIMQALQKSGITSIHDIEGENALEAFKQLRSAGQLGIRVQMILPRQMLPQLQRHSIPIEENDLLCIGGIKIFADGTLGSQTAAMLESFEGNPDNFGLLALSEQEMTETIRSATALKLSTAIHVIGDRAAHVALNAIENVQHQFAQNVNNTQRPVNIRYRLEHVQLITTEDLQRMRRLDVVASVQPLHAVADRDIAERYWGERYRHSYAYRTMREMGIPLAAGSDAPVEIFDPLQILYAATTRRAPGNKRAPWLPEQSLSLADALWSYTGGAAYAGAEGQHKGTLTTGKFGDAVVLDEDIFAQPAENITENRVIATILAGRIVHGDI